MTLLVSEVFGPIIQGEGVSIGRPCEFLRLGGCNLSCVWCDTPYTWDWTGKNGVKYDPKVELHKLSFVDVAAYLIKCRPGGNIFTIVASGGEPMLQQHTLTEFIPWMRDALHGAGIKQDV